MDSGPAIDDLIGEFVTDISETDSRATPISRGATPIEFRATPISRDGTPTGLLSRGATPTKGISSGMRDEAIAEAFRQLDDVLEDSSASASASADVASADAENGAEAEANQSADGITDSTVAAQVLKNTVVTSFGTIRLV